MDAKYVDDLTITLTSLKVMFLLQVCLNSVTYYLMCANTNHKELGTQNVTEIRSGFSPPHRRLHLVSLKHLTSSQGQVVQNA